eukprot:3371004-Prymnesium_polylepis.1
MSGTKVVNSTANTGGAAHLSEGSSLTMSGGSEIDHASSTTEGGAVHVTDSSLTVMDSTIQYASAGTD